MRKVFAILLSLIMVLSVCAAGVSAETADPIIIKTIDDYKAIADNLSGYYKLGNDLVVEEDPRLGGSAIFTGIFDGDGHTVTLKDCTGGFFSEINGAKIMNLTLEGDIRATGNAGAIANSGKGPFELTNIINKVNVSSTKDSAYLGGLIGSISGDKDAEGKASATHLVNSYITGCVNYGRIHAGAKSPRIGGLTGNTAKYCYINFKDCVNYGEIDISQDEGKTKLAKTPYVGGIASDCFAGKFENCLNEGKLSSVVSTHMGGIVGRFMPSAQMDDQSGTIINCTNKGDLYAAGGYMGGIIGCAGCDPDGSDYVCKKAFHIIDKCENYGTLTGSGSGSIGGIVGNCPGKNGVEFTTISNCVNYGTVGSTYFAEDTARGTFVSQILGLTNCGETTITDCVGYGKIENADRARSTAVGTKEFDAKTLRITRLILLENDGTVNYSYSDEDADAANRIAMADRPADMITIGNANAVGSAAAGLGRIGYIDPNAPVNPPEDPPVNPPVDPPVTGDALVAVIVVALVSVLGMGIAVKSRQN